MRYITRVYPWQPVGAPSGGSYLCTEGRHRVGWLECPVRSMDRLGHYGCLDEGSNPSRGTLIKKQKVRFQAQIAEQST